MYIKVISRKESHINIKCFQVNWLNWSNLYLGTVPLIAIANIHKKKTLVNKT